MSLPDHLSPVPMPTPTRVFISYSHDSADHKLQVLELANQLRRDGVDAHIDQYVEFPEDGWPRWMRSKIEEADVVLVVCSPVYKSRFEGVYAPGKGLGARWEGLILTQSLYEDFAQNRARFIPILIGDTPDAAIPVVLRPFTYFRIPGQYERLYRLITKQPAVVEPPVGPVRTLPAEAPTSQSPTPPLPLGGNPYSDPSGTPPLGSRHPQPPRTEESKRRDASPKEVYMLAEVLELSSNGNALLFTFFAEKDSAEDIVQRDFEAKVFPAILPQAKDIAICYSRARGPFTLTPIGKDLKRIGVGAVGVFLFADKVLTGHRNFSFLKFIFSGSYRDDSDYYVELAQQLLSRFSSK